MRLYFRVKFFSGKFVEIVKSLVDRRQQCEWGRLYAEAGYGGPKVVPIAIYCKTR